MYMSYCRFEGTLAEMRACISDVEEHINEEAQYEVSEREIESFKRMVLEFNVFLQDNVLLDEYGNLDDDQLDKICDTMRKSYNEEDEDYGND